MDPYMALAPERDFFWARYIDRALSHLKHLIKPKCLQKVDAGYCGDANMSIRIMEIQTNRAVSDPAYICMFCGSQLKTLECESCYTFIIGHKKGWCYFVIDHFEGKDYSIAFTVDDSFDYEKMCEELKESPIENDFVKPCVHRNLKFKARPMGLKRKKC